MLSLCGASLAVASEAPVALWVSDPVKPGQTVLVFGDGFAGSRSVQLSRLADTSSGRAVTVTVAPAQVRQRSVKFVVPTSFSPGVYRATASTPHGAVTVLVNRPQVLWAQGDRGPTGTPGGWLRVVGKCLAWTKRGAVLRLQGAKRIVQLSPTHAHLFTLVASLPASLVPGAYRLTVNSGCGGAAGWSLPIPFQVVPRSAAPSLRVNVETFGARGDDADDDTVTIQKALESARTRGGGVVTLPRGRFVLSDMLTVPPGVTLRGAGIGLTALCWSDTDTPPPALLKGTGRFVVRDLTLYAINYQNGIIADQTGPNAGHVKIQNVRLRLDPYRGHLTPETVDKRFRESLLLSSGGGDSLRLGGPDVEVSGCDVYGAGRCLYLSRGRGVWIHDNAFSNGRWGWYCLSGNNGVIFERNTITGGDLMSTGGGLNCLDGSTVSQNVYYAGNTLRNMFGWDREAMTTDAGGGAYYGRVAGAQGSLLTLAADPKWGGRDWAGAGVFILDGLGQGQYRQIVQTDGRRVTLDRPWVIPPDDTSLVTITMLQRNYLFVGNSFADAGVAIQMYGTAIGNIASGNVSARTGGFHNFGMNYDGIQPSWFVQWLDNRITEGNVYGGGHDQSMAVGEAHLGVFCLPPGVTPDAPLTLCAVVRGNRLDNNAHLAIGGSDPPNSGLRYPYVQEVVVEGNRVANAEVGLRIARASFGVLARNNTFVNCRDSIVDDQTLDRRTAAERAKLFAQPGPLLHLTFDHPDGLVFRDVTGHGFDARVQGRCVPAPDGVKGGCVALDGQGSYLSVARPSLLKMDSFTLSVWVRTDHVAGRWGFLSKRIGSAPAPFVLGEFNGGLLFEATDDKGQWSFNVTSPPVLTPHTWHHVAAVMRAGEGVTLYLDGVEVAHKDNAHGLTQTDDPLCLGRDAWGGDPADNGQPAFFAGSLDDLQIWPRALSAAEVARLE